MGGKHLRFGQPLPQASHSRVGAVHSGSALARCRCARRAGNRAPCLLLGRAKGLHQKGTACRRRVLRLGQVRTRAGSAPRTVASSGHLGRIPAAMLSLRAVAPAAPAKRRMGARHGCGSPRVRRRRAPRRRAKSGDAASDTVPASRVCVAPDALFPGQPVVAVKLSMCPALPWATLGVAAVMPRQEPGGARCPPAWGVRSVLAPRDRPAAALLPRCPCHASAFAVAGSMSNRRLYMK
eukprot:scaffold26908_cov101-Isochrysis_galbana.AAC.1